jgi:hypothetical protein
MQAAGRSGGNAGTIESQARKILRCRCSPLRNGRPIHRKARIVLLMTIRLFLVTTLNQLYLPANRPIIVKLRSKDVIHSFGVPEFRVKQDGIPGLTIPIWFIPNVTTAEMRTRTGNPEFQYEIACAQLCGLGHYRMRRHCPEP